jgi:hypothetical protein
MRLSHPIGKTALCGVLILACSTPAFALEIGGIKQIFEIVSSKLAKLSPITDFLKQASDSISQLTEQTAILKTAFHGSKEIIEAGWDGVGRKAARGVRSGVPLVDKIYNDTRKLVDLNYSDPKAVETINGMLYANVYGPGVAYLDNQLARNMDSVSKTIDLGARQKTKLEAEHIDNENLVQDCNSSGSCRTAADKATILQNRTLADLHAIALQELELQRQQLVTRDQAELRHNYAFLRFANDFSEHAYAAFGPQLEEGVPCNAGSCLYETYRSAAYEALREVRGRRAGVLHEHRTLPATLGGNAADSTLWPR